MNISSMKNIVVLRNLPSNLVDEAIVVLKENKKVKKYQYVDETVNQKAKNISKTTDKNVEKNEEQYIVKEAELLIDNYIKKLETKSPKWKNNMKKLEAKYKISVKLNFLLGFATIISLWISLI